MKIVVLLCVFNLGMIVAFKLASNQSLDAHTQAVNNFYNWPEKECYKYIEVEQILKNVKK